MVSVPTHKTLVTVAVRSTPRRAAQGTSGKRMPNSIRRRPGETQGCDTEEKPVQQYLVLGGPRGRAGETGGAGEGMRNPAPTRGPSRDATWELGELAEANNGEAPRGTAGVSPPASFPRGARGASAGQLGEEICANLALGTVGFRRGAAERARPRACAPRVRATRGARPRVTAVVV